MTRPDVLKHGGKSADHSPKSDTGGAAHRIGRFTLDLARGCLTDGAGDVGLRPKTYELLCYLAGNRGRLISKDELISAVWPNVVVTDDSLVRCIAELRRALADDDRRLIRTVSRRGYRFEPEPADAEAALPSRQRWRRHAAVGFLLLLIVLAAGALFTARDAAAPPFSIAVLPFVTRGVDADQAYIGDGFASDLTADLARLPGFVVIAHATARTFGTDDRDIRGIGRLLNVRYLLTGSIDRTADTYRINAELVGAESGAALWVERFASPRDRIAASREEILGRIATSLHFELTRLESRRSQAERPDDPQASDLTARGWSLVYAGKLPDNYSAGRELFREAVRHDPRAVNALAGIGWTSAIMVLDGWSPSPSGDIGIAAEAVSEALAIDPDHVVARHVRGFLFRLQRRPASARDAFRTVIALNPNFAPGHAQLGITELELGHPEAVRPAVETAMRLSPRDPSLGPWLAFVGMAELHRGNPRGAIDWLERAIDTGTPVARHRAYLASALALDGHMTRAEEALSAFLQAGPDATIADLRANARSDEPEFVAQRERFLDGLRLAGLPEQAPGGASQ